MTAMHGIPCEATTGAGVYSITGVEPTVNPTPKRRQFSSHMKLSRLGGGVQ